MQRETEGWKNVVSYRGKEFLLIFKGTHTNNQRMEEVFLSRALREKLKYSRLFLRDSDLEKGPNMFSGPSARLFGCFRYECSNADNPLTVYLLNLI